MIMIPHFLLEYGITISFFTNNLQKSEVCDFVVSKPQMLRFGFRFFVIIQVICVVTNGAMRFGCVVPFGTTHFYFKGGKQNEQ